MRKLIIVTVLILFICSGVWAQSDVVLESLLQVHQELIKHRERIENLEQKTDVFTSIPIEKRSVAEALPFPELEKRIAALEKNQQAIGALAKEILKKVKSMPQAHAAMTPP